MYGEGGIFSEVLELYEVLCVAKETTAINCKL